MADKVWNSFFPEIGILTSEVKPNPSTSQLGLYNIQGLFHIHGGVFLSCVSLWAAGTRHMWNGPLCRLCLHLECWWKARSSGWCLYDTQTLTPLNHARSNRVEVCTINPDFPFHILWDLRSTWKIPAGKWSANFSDFNFDIWYYAKILHYHP